MNIETLSLPGVLLITPKVFGDARGYFVETFANERYAEAGINIPFVQDNLSRSPQGVLRGLHLQNPHGQGKLVQVVEGSVFDVAVDVRVGSPHFGKWVGAELSAENHCQLWVPPGFAHGFVVTSEHALFSYKCTDTYHPECELSVLWNDPAIGIDWPVESPVLSDKDASANVLADVDEERLPRWQA
ncbi:MAG: dTDP-4-dehydrorhamnose 3,5-epimerase [Polyangiales bacterium]